MCMTVKINIYIHKKMQNAARDNGFENGPSDSLQIKLLFYLSTNYVTSHAPFQLPIGYHCPTESSARDIG